MRLILAALVAVSSALFSLSAQAADVCPRGVMKEGYLVYKVCAYQDVGPAKNLVWAEGESRHRSVWTELRKSGTLPEGKFSVEINLENVNLKKGATFFYTDVNGAEKRIEVLPLSSNTSITIVVGVLNGEGSLWVPYTALTTQKDNVLVEIDEHYVQMRGVEKVLRYNHPQFSWFTKEGEWKSIVGSWSGKGSITLFTKI